MLLLIAALVIFLGVHSLRIVAEGSRTAIIEKLGPLGFKALYSIVSLVSFVMIVKGYAAARLTTPALWTPPTAMAHVAALLMLVSFILLVAAYIPGNRIRRAVGHPMVLAVKVWAIAHLLANGGTADVVLFGAFLVWAVVDYASARRRDRAAGTPATAVAGIGRDAATVVVGALAWVAFAMWLHRALIGVAPFG